MLGYLVKERFAHCVHIMTKKNTGKCVVFKIGAMKNSHTNSV